MVNSKEMFILKAIDIQGNNFNYDKFEYFGSKIKSVIVCNKCNVEFLSTPSNHLIGYGCKNCDNIKRGLSLIIIKLKNIYPDWIFNLNNYLNSDSIISFTCSNHHNGTNTYRNISRYNVCGICRNFELLNNRISIIESNNLKVLNFISDDEINCKCNSCSFEISDNYRNLSYNKFKCKYCILIDKSELIKDGSVILIDIDSINITLSCKSGHIYKQDRRNLLANKRCYQCYKDEKKISIEEVKKKIRLIHGSIFKYDFNDFKNIHSKIRIVCDKGHEFSQKTSNHLQGKGCPICRESFGERTIRIFLEKNKIDYIRQKRFSDCKYQNKLPFDFYLKKHNICIEYDGIQHFEPVGIFGGEDEFKKTKIKDKIKDEYCLLNDIHLLRISYVDDILSKLELLQKSIIF